MKTLREIACPTKACRVVDHHCVLVLPGLAATKWELLCCGGLGTPRQQRSSTGTQARRRRTNQQHTPFIHQPTYPSAVPTERPGVLSNVRAALRSVSKLVRPASHARQRKPTRCIYRNFTPQTQRRNHRGAHAMQTTTMTNRPPHGQGQRQMKTSVKDISKKNVHKAHTQSTQRTHTSTHTIWRGGTSCIGGR